MGRAEPCGGWGCVPGMCGREGMPWDAKDDLPRKVGEGGMRAPFILMLVVVVVVVGLFS